VHLRVWQPVGHQRQRLQLASGEAGRVLARPGRGPDGMPRTPRLRLTMFSRLRAEGSQLLDRTAHGVLVGGVGERQPVRLGHSVGRGLVAQPRLAAPVGELTNDPRGFDGSGARARRL